MAGEQQNRNPRTSSVVYRTGGVYVETNLQEKPARAYDPLQDVGTFSLDNLDENVGQYEIRDVGDVRLNLRGDDVSQYARYGSLRLLFKALINDLLATFPGALRFLPSAAHSYSYDASADKSTLLLSVAHLDNPFELFYRTSTEFEQEKEMRNLNHRWRDYEVYRPDIGRGFPLLRFLGATATGNTITLEVSGAFLDENESLSGVEVLLRPSSAYWERYQDRLHPFQRHLLSRPDHRLRRYDIPLTWQVNDADGLPVGVSETLSWPFPDGHNLEIGTDRFMAFYQRLLRVGEEYDEREGNQLGRYVPNSLQGQDFTSEGKMGKFMQVISRFLDEQRNRISAFPSIFRWRYDQQDAVPAQLTLQQASNEGWVTVSLLDEQRDDERLWHTLARQTHFIFGQKGGRRAVEDFINLLGLIPGLVRIDEYIYEISDIQAYPEPRWDRYFQQRGDEDGGSTYIDYLSGTQIIYLQPDGRKSWSQVNDRHDRSWDTRYELYYNGQHEVNTKYIDFTIRREEILAIFQQEQEECDPDALRHFERLLDEQINRFQNIYFPYIREHLLGATVIFSSQSQDVISIRHDMLASSPGGSDGGVRLEVQGGTPPYTFHWSDGSVNSQPFNDNLPAGDHWVLVVDSGSPPLGRRFNFTVLENPLVAWRPAEPVCSLQNYGYREYNVLEQYNTCLDEPTGISKPNLPGDPNYVEPYPTLDCVDREIAISVSKVDTPCWDSGAGGGSYNLSVQYAVAPFKYFYQNSQGSWVEINSSSRSNLTKGTYRYRVADVLGRSKEGSVTIGSQSSRPSISLTPTAATGCSLNSGSIRASVSGGRGSYSYTWQKLNSSWSNISVNSSTNPSNLSPGTYRLRIIDDCGSTYSSSVNVADNTTLSSLSIGNISVFTASDGPNCPATLKINYSGTPAGSVRFEWKNSAGTVVGTSQTFNQAVGGETYSVTIWDDCKAKGTLSRSLKVPNDRWNDFTVTGSVSDTTSTTTPNGSITINLSDASKFDRIDLYKDDGTGDWGSYSADTTLNASNTFGSLPEGRYRVRVSPKCHNPLFYVYEVALEGSEPDPSLPLEYTNYQSQTFIFPETGSGDGIIFKVKNPNSNAQGLATIFQTVEFTLEWQSVTSSITINVNEVGGPSVFSKQFTQQSDHSATYSFDAVAGKEYEVQTIMFESDLSELADAATHEFQVVGKSAVLFTFQRPDGTSGGGTSGGGTGTGGAGGGA